MVWLINGRSDKCMVEHNACSVSYHIQSGVGGLSHFIIYLSRLAR